MTTWKEIKDNPAARQRLEQKSAIIRSIREWFWGRGFLEMTTPLAVNKMIQEKYLQPMPVMFHDPSGKEFPFFLVTSPEIGLKKLLGAGMEKIFQIGPVFRDYENFGKTHNPEFLMLEWYRSPGGLEDIINDTEEMVRKVAKDVGVSEIAVEGKKIRIDCEWEKISMKDLWFRYLEVNLDEYLGNEKIAELARSFGYPAEANEPYEDNFYKIFLNKIEPFLGWERPVIIFDYPYPMAALCKVKDSDKNFVERFECYIAGLELANAYGELVDIEEQKKRMVENHSFRKENNLVLSPLDDDLNQAVAEISSAGGIALGVERLVMLLTNANDINEVIFESAYDQVERK